MKALLFISFSSIVGMYFGMQYGSAVGFASGFFAWVILVGGRVLWHRMGMGLNLELIDPSGPVYQLKTGLTFIPLPSEESSGLRFFILNVDGARYFLTIDSSRKIYSISVPMGELNPGPVVDMQSYESVPWVKLIAKKMC